MVNASPHAIGAKGRSAGVHTRHRPLRLALAGAALVLLGACSYLPEMPSLPSMPTLPGADVFDSPRQLRGHLVDEEDLRQVVVGVSSQRDVQTLLGSPSATGTFDDRDWFYIGGVTRQRPGRLLAVDDQRVVRIRFDNQGTVREVASLGPEDGRDVQAVSRITPSPGNERTLMQQLFGNIGRVGPGIAGAAPTGPGPQTPQGR
ncbi:MAG TPA: outer membrane protein assembly factor BamE [Falsiroseomonas sp.]|jgi:outer membrane protein assembly factor BamE (lipoprotein component of BamABCDE complex)|nr:outer membrane protein assembly factor BamE [Falsiroseomonas sp.]